MYMTQNTDTLLPKKVTSVTICFKTTGLFFHIISLILKNVSKSEIANLFMCFFLFLSPVDVTLDPATAAGWVVLSPDNKKVSCNYQLHDS